MSEPKSIGKSAEQLVNQQMRLNSAISKEMYDIVSKYRNNESMSAEDKARLDTLSARSSRVTRAYMRMADRNYRR